MHLWVKVSKKKPTLDEGNSSSFFSEQWEQRDATRGGSIGSWLSSWNKVLIQKVILIKSQQSNRNM